jgi:hypothetical protein
MGSKAWVLAVVCSLGIGSPALAQESRTMGQRAVAVGDVVHCTQEMNMDVDMTAMIDGVSTEPIAMKLKGGEAYDLKLTALRAPTHPKGALYEVEVLRLDEVEPMKGTRVSTLVGRTLVVDMGKQKVKPVSGAKLTSEEQDELFDTIKSAGGPFAGGLKNTPDAPPRVYTVGQQVDPVFLGGTLPSDLPDEISVVVQSFEAGPGGELANLTIAMSGTVDSDGQAMDVQMSGTIQIDVATGWPLRADMSGTVAVDNAAVSTDKVNMHLSMKGPMRILMTAGFTTTDGRSFAGVAE